jgi:hypothetical protein
MCERPGSSFGSLAKLSSSRGKSRATWPEELMLLLSLLP